MKWHATLTPHTSIRQEPDPTTTIKVSNSSTQHSMLSTHQTDTEVMPLSDGSYDTSQTRSMLNGTDGGRPFRYMSHHVYYTLKRHWGQTNEQCHIFNPFYTPPTHAQAQPSVWSSKEHACRRYRVPPPSGPGPLLNIVPMYRDMEQLLLTLHHTTYGWNKPRQYSIRKGSQKVWYLLH